MNNIRKGMTNFRAYVGGGGMQGPGGTFSRDRVLAGTVYFYFPSTQLAQHWKAPFLSLSINLANNKCPALINVPLRNPESPLDCTESQPVHPKGNQSWIFTGRTDAEAETPILWPPHAKSWLIGKDPDAGNDWRQEEKGTTEDKIVGWHHWLNGHEFE